MQAHSNIPFVATIPLTVLNTIPYQQLDPDIQNKIYFYFLLKLSPLLASLACPSIDLFRKNAEAKYNEAATCRYQTFEAGIKRFGHSPLNLFTQIITHRTLEIEHNIYFLLGYARADWLHRQNLPKQDAKQQMVLDVEEENWLKLVGESYAYALLDRLDNIVNYGVKVRMLNASQGNDYLVSLFKDVPYSLDTYQFPRVPEKFWIESTSLPSIQKLFWLMAPTIEQMIEKVSRTRPQLESINIHNHSLPPLEEQMNFKANKPEAVEPIILLNSLQKQSGGYDARQSQIQPLTVGMRK